MTAGLDIRTIIILLALGDVAAIVIILASVGRTLRERPAAAFVAGKLLQGTAWTLLAFRDHLPDFLTVFVGNGLLFAGFAAEADAIGSVRGRDQRQEVRYLLTISVGFVLFVIFSGAQNLRVAIASLVTVAIYSQMAAMLLRQARGSPIRLTIGIAAILYSAALLARAAVSTSQNGFALFTPTLVQYLAFVPLYLALILGSVGFILLLKERDDTLLRESEEKYRSVAERASEAIIIIQDGKYVYANRQAAELYGVADPSALLGQEVGGRVAEEDRERVLARFHARLEGRDVASSDEYRFVGVDGRRIWVASSASLIPYQGKTATLVLLSDIDERRRQQERIESLLAEKELLLREVNHRVKNNLGVAMSLLSLQAASVGNRRAEDALAEAQALLATMSELYESLHRAGSTGVLSVRDYLPSLVDEVVRLFPRTPPARFELDLDDIELDARVLSPLGIMLNEIMTNSLRHGFSESTIDAVISISAKLRGDHIVLDCRDNGKGLPAGYDPAASSGFGSSVILALAGQLRATWRVDGSKGTVWHFEFPRNDHPR